MNVYENLYENMKSRFTVVNNDAEYTLGEIMLIKAGKKKEASNLPAVKTNNQNTSAVVAFFNYVNDKLTLKAPPAKDKTIRRFPLRTSLAAMLSAVVACSLVISYGSATLRTADKNLPAIAEYTENTDELGEIENPNGI